MSPRNPLALHNYRAASTISSKFTSEFVKTNKHKLWFHLYTHHSFSIILLQEFYSFHYFLFLLCINHQPDFTLNSNRSSHSISHTRDTLACTAIASCTLTLLPSQFPALGQTCPPFFTTASFLQGQSKGHRKHEVPKLPLDKESDSTAWHLMGF